MKDVHFIGIGGIGMSGLAQILLSQDIKVTGSDLTESRVTKKLAEAGATLFIGHCASYVKPGTTVVYTSDIQENNPEYLAAKNLQCPLLHRSDLLSLLMQKYQTLAVTGTHGKTTTSSLLTWVLHVAGQDPSFAVGGVIAQLDANAGHGHGKYFVAEADESDGSFLCYRPFGGIITNIGLDHMNYYQTEEALSNAFHTFSTQIESAQHLFWCRDDERLRKLNIQGVSYGFDPVSDLRILKFTQKGWKTVFDVVYQGKQFSQIEISQIGSYNVLNASAVFGLALNLGIDEQLIRKGLATFPGVGRRCTHRGEVQGVLFIDDYAHHPNEIRATLKAIRHAIGEKRLIVLFQPHRYTRTKECLGTYQGIFAPADLLYITDIYAAGEEEIPGLSHENILAELKLDRQLSCSYASRQGIADCVYGKLLPHDVVVTLGAGDIHTAIPAMMQLIEKKPPKIHVGVIYGGKSAEHAVSHLSAKHILDCLKTPLYEVTPFLITQEGKWRLPENPMDESEEIIPGFVWQKLQECTIHFPVLHGPFGEDGTIQGFFETLGKPYVGCDHQSAAICMDKTVTKRLIEREGMLTSPFVAFNQSEWHLYAAEIACQIKQELTFPVIVKPAHLGSSIGVKKVESVAQLPEAIQYAFIYDTVVLVENFIKGREIEFAVFGNDAAHVFPPGEILTSGELYDYQGKYSPDRAMPTAEQAQLLPEWIEQGMSLALKAYQAATCKGMARVDFFMDETGCFWFNEINPIPGFTPYSLYPQICKVNGLPGTKLMDQLIILGLQRMRHKNKKDQMSLAI
ncbi:MAG: UDP-N-acetylmuramate--L-alanine ligase [Parachlamydia sp.]|nr:MAG: UDP-N-acetylmuramate--L-alanine ligase [Parachlamydia sp.]